MKKMIMDQTNRLPFKALVNFSEILNLLNEKIPKLRDFLCSDAQGLTKKEPFTDVDASTPASS